MVAFSRFHEDDQLQAIAHLLRWVQEALLHWGIKESEYRWSGAGDGGYLTFGSPRSCEKAIDVAFSIAQKIREPEWTPRAGELLQLRMALHAGTVQEAEELGRGTNIWGMGINTAARILTVALEAQLLVSRQYHDTYIANRRHGFEIGTPYQRTVKHGVYVEVMNINYHDLCLSNTKADALRWQAVGGLWERTMREYTYLVADTMQSDEPAAALAAAKFLLRLGNHDEVARLCQMIGGGPGIPDATYPRRQHSLFSAMPAETLQEVLEQAMPRKFERGQVICREGEVAHSCYVPIAGTIEIELPDHRVIRSEKGQLFGEFGLWIEGLPRTATLRAIEGTLMLEIHHDRFRSILRDRPEVLAVIEGTIRGRILENVRRSPRLFPAVPPSASIPASVERFVAGTEVPLTENAFVLFCGAMRVGATRGRHLDVVANGTFADLPVVGIVSVVESPDGDRAVALRDTVAVRLARTTIQDLQTNYLEVRRAWDGMCGERIGDFRCPPAAPVAAPPRDE